MGASSSPGQACPARPTCGWRDEAVVSQLTSCGGGPGNRVGKAVQTLHELFRGVDGATVRGSYLKLSGQTIIGSANPRRIANFQKIHPFSHLPPGATVRLRYRRHDCTNPTRE